MRADQQNLIAGELSPVFIHRNESVPVSIKGKPGGSAVFPNVCLQVSGVLGTAAVVDVYAVRVIVNDRHICSEVLKECGCGFVGCPIGRIQNNLHSPHGQIVREMPF